MTKTYKIIQTDGTKGEIEIDAIKICPLCNNGIDPQFIFGIEIEYQEDKWCCILIFRCTCCEDVFIARYNYDNGYNVLNYLYPIKASAKFNKIISDISPKFIEIYNEAKCAENLNLNHICGTGYRKALEFLIKDYIIYNNDNEEKVKSMQLSDCINSYILFDELKDTSVIASWIGNDETHYERKNKDLDIEDLKKYIDTTVFWICAKVNSKKAKQLKNKK